MRTTCRALLVMHAIITIACAKPRPVAPTAPTESPWTFDSATMTMATATPMFQPTYRCPIHGPVGQMEPMLSIDTSAGPRLFCMRCVGDLLAHALPSLEPIKP